MFIRKTIIPIKKCLIQNLYNFLKTITFICNIFSHPIKFGEKIEFLFLIVFITIKTKTVDTIKKW